MSAAENSTPALDAITLEHYSFRYAGSGEKALDDISLSLPSGSFTLLCGLTGSGKSTLLRALKPELSVAGDVTGAIRIHGVDPVTLDPPRSARMVGFVMQDPENQLVTDTVWHELAFGLENIGVEREAMRRRVAETAHFFGIGAWFDHRVSDLSGGQKQLLNLAAVVVMQPALLILDEPTSQLDPIAAKDFLDVLGRVNDELGITVVITEHRLEDVLPMADHVVFLDRGTLSFMGTPDAFIGRITGGDAGFAVALPAATRIARLFEPHADEPLPVTVREGRSFLARRLADVRPAGVRPATTDRPSAVDQPAAVSRHAAPDQSAAVRRPVSVGKPAGGRTSDDVALRASDIWFRYDKADPFVLRGVDFEVRRGTIAAIVGGNGAGKSTLLGALSGVRKPERGKVRKAGGAKVALLAQDPKTLFVCDTLYDDLREWREYGGYEDAAVDEMMERFGLSHLAARHPYDLSGGETQKAALAKVLLLDPDVLLLDEPVKGIDAIAKVEVGRILMQLADAGKAVLFTSHDLEFVSQVAETCSMMFGCEITCTQDCHGFFQDNLFYSTATSRITRGLIDGCVTTDDVACALGEKGTAGVFEPASTTDGSASTTDGFASAAAEPLTVIADKPASTIPAIAGGERP